MNKNDIYYFPLIKLIPTKLFLRFHYLISCHKNLDLKNPHLFNEKLQWLKINDQRDVYMKMVDKLEAKKYVSRIIGDKYIIPTIGVWNEFDEINFNNLPTSFVLKTSHDSGGVVIVKDKYNCDINGAKKFLTKSLKRNYYYKGRELPYKNISPRLFAEQLLVDESGYELKDYKIFCFSGAPRLIQVDYDRFNNHKRNIYTTSWKYVPVQIQFPTDSKHIINKPAVLNEMLLIASRLSKGIPFLRVDLYVSDNRVYFGELTLFHGSGFEKIIPYEWNQILGDWIEING